MGIITAREQKFHRMLQRYLTLLDYEIIGDRFKMSPRSIQGIAQGRRNNVKVLLALFEVAQENMKMEHEWFHTFDGVVEAFNKSHFEGRAKLGIDEERDDETNSHENQNEKVK